MLSDRPLIADIRDARGLNQSEKSFLYTVASHHEGVMFGTAEKCAEDMGMGRSTFFRTGSSLIDKGYLLTISVYGKATKYKLNRSRLQSQIETVPERESRIETV